MSDGNFNTQLLSHGGFTSGVRAGEARMKQRAVAALFQLLVNDCGFCDEEAHVLCAKLKTCLDKGGMQRTDL